MPHMKQTSPPARRFGPDFVETQRRGYDNRPAEQRKRWYDSAVQDEFALGGTGWTRSSRCCRGRPQTPWPASPARCPST
jgi:hypothetical protein